MKEQDKGARAEWRRVFIRLPWLSLIPLGLLIPRLCEGRQARIERVFSGDLYRWIAAALSAASSWAPFSIAEILLYILIFCLCLSLITHTFRVIFGRARLAALLRRLVGCAVLFGVALNLFYLSWGLNYFREPLGERMSPALEIRARPIEELEDLSVQLARRANALRERLPEDEYGVAALPNGYREIFDVALPKAYAALAEEDPAFSGRVTRVKAVICSRGLSWCGITGVYVGFTAEPNVNVDAPAFLLPHTAAHELAHQLGVASEDEAEFAGYLACLRSEDPAVVYSGALAALLDCGNALYEQDPARYLALRELYGEGLLRDLRYQRAYWDGFEGDVERLATETNDAYLKHNGQESGVKSYGEAVDLLLAYYERNKNFLAG